MKKKVIAIIPARMAASRFPGKPLAKILDLPMIEHVRRRALLSKCLDEVYVATCDQEILDTVQRHGGKAVMTADTHQRCTDRVEEAAVSIAADIVVILQGDEPLFDGKVIERLVNPLLDDDKIICSNILTPITHKEDLSNPDIVKAVLDPKGQVLYFSRAAVPYMRVEHPCPVYRQTGISAFTKDFLRRFSKLEPTPLEIAESVDFLRILEHRYPILGVVYNQVSIGVDRPNDVAVVENVLKTDALQKKIYAEIAR